MSATQTGKLRSSVAESTPIDKLAADWRSLQHYQLFKPSIDRLAQADVKDVQEIAGAQVDLLTKYHEIVLAQSRRSFFWALIGSGVGLAFFLVAVASSLHATAAQAIIPVIAGAVVEVVSGVVFYLYGKTTAQLSDFHHRLETVQRHLLANSICESLSEPNRDQARMLLISQIAAVPPQSCDAAAKAAPHAA